MLTLPDAILPVLHPFATLFRNPTWLKAQILLVGAILAPGQRTVAAALRVMGRSDHLDYARYHEVLNRAVWSPRQAARILLMLLLQHLDQGDGPLVFGIDETLERRRGPKIKARGVYRDAVRSSRQQLVKASGLRWISLMWLGHVPWAGRYWALPFLTVLAPSERYHRQRGRRHKKLTDWARQMILQLRRWLPHRPLVLVGDSSYAVLDLLHCCQSLAQPVTLIARLRLDAALYEPAPPPSARSERSASAERPTAASAEDTPGLAHRVLGHRVGSLVRRHYPHVGTHLANGGLVPLGQGRRYPCVGSWFGTPKANSLPRPCSAPIRRRIRRRSWNGLCCAGNWRSPSRRCGRIWAWRPSASGRIRPSLAPRRSWWSSSPGPPWRPICCGNNDPRPIAQRLGTPSRRRPSWMPSPWCAATCGWRPRVFHCPPPTLIYGKSRPLCTTDLSIPLLTPLEMRKVQLKILHPLPQDRQFVRL